MSPYLYLLTTIYCPFPVLQVREKFDKITIDSLFLISDIEELSFYSTYRNSRVFISEGYTLLHQLVSNCLTNMKLLKHICTNRETMSMIIQQLFTVDVDSLEETVF